MDNSLRTSSLACQGYPETVVSLRIVGFDLQSLGKMDHGFIDLWGSSQQKRRIFLFLCKVHNVGQVNLSIKMFHIFVRYAWGSVQQKDLDKFHANDQEITDPDF